MSHQRTMQSYQKGLFTQGENAAETYTINWSNEIDEDTIATSTWTAENSGSTVAGEASTDNTASARLSGTPGRYLFTNKITLTTSGDTFEAQLELIVQNNDRGVQSDYCDYRH